MDDARAPDPATDPAAEAPPDVFVSYARENRDAAQRLADALAENRLRVWWDRDLAAGSEFATVIETQLNSAAVVLGLWSVDSVRSAFVRDECGHALRAGKLLPVRIEEVDLPLGFGQLHTLDLLDWDGDADDEAFQALMREIERRRTRAPIPLEATLPPPRIGRRMLRRVALGVAVVAALGGTGYYAKHTIDQRAQAEREAQLRIEAARQLERNRTEADRHFRAGLEFQLADVPRLENALNEYLTALERLPTHGRARFYLGHIYAQTGRSADAYTSFQLALQAAEAPLDPRQKSEAERQLVALAPNADEAAPVTRPVASAAGPAPAPAGDTPSQPTVVAGGAGSVGGEFGSAAGDIVTRGRPRPAARPPPPPSATGPVPVAADGPRTPPHIDPPPATRSRLERSVAAMFDDNKDRRISATTSLIVEPDDLSDAVPIAVARALQALRSPPLVARESSGVINTLVLLQSALPGTLTSNRAAIEELLAAADGAGDYTRQQATKVRQQLQQALQSKPVGYLQIASEAQRPMAERIVQRLRSSGYAAPAIEVVGTRAPARTELRVQGKSDRAYSRWIAKVISDVTGTTPAVSPLRNAKPKVDTYEIWLGRDL
jgi:tetratricopeptide (TPR) repeat protein